MYVLTDTNLTNRTRLSFIATLLVLLVAAQSQAVRADEIAIWNFNDSNLIVDHGVGTLITSFPSFTFATGTSINARLGDPALQALVLGGNANNGQSFTISLSTIGFGSLSVSLATQRTSTGFNANQFQYSLDGVSFIDFQAPFSPATAFGPVIFDLSSIAGLANNPNVAFRIVLDGATSSGGNNRIDNLVVEGVPIAAEPIPEPATLTLFSLGLAIFGARRVRKRLRR